MLFRSKKSAILFSSIIIFSPALWLCPQCGPEKLRFPGLRAFALSEYSKTENFVRAQNFLLHCIPALLNLNNILRLRHNMHLAEELPCSLILRMLKYFFRCSVFYYVSFIKEDHTVRHMADKVHLIDRKSTRLNSSHPSSSRMPSSA